MNAPGSLKPNADRRGHFSKLSKTVERGALWWVDARVVSLHAHVLPAIRARAPLDVVVVKAGEPLKSVERLGALAPRFSALKRDGLMVAVGGGTVGDFATVAAHLCKRGVRLVHVPTTLLAAVDSSVGGKGALNVGTLKNALGVFHYPEAGLLCPELWTTLSPAQHREGLAEALKMFLCLDEKAWQSTPKDFVTAARALKFGVCEEDPYEQRGRRTVLNFGHTFGHAIESLTHYRVRHGEAVALGMLKALDVGVREGVTPPRLAASVEARLESQLGPLRSRLDRVLSGVRPAQLRVLLGADKKADAQGLKMVLLRGVGDAVTQRVSNPL